MPKQDKKEKGKGKKTRREHADLHQKKVEHHARKLARKEKSDRLNEKFQNQYPDDIWARYVELGDG